MAALRSLLDTLATLTLCAAIGLWLAPASQVLLTLAFGAAR